MSDKKIRRKIKTFVLSSKFWWALIFVGFLSRIATWFFPFDSDHWIFYYVGSHWFDGGTLYLTVWDHKTPLIFSINGLMSYLMNDSIVLHRIFFTFVAALSLWIFYITSKRLLGFIGVRNIESSSRIATIFYAFWSNLSQFTNSGNSTENFGVLFLLLSYYLYFRYRDNHRLKWLLLSGLSLSTLIFLKINFAILIIPLVIDFIKQEARNIKKFIGLGIVWVAPTILQILAWGYYFKDRDLLNEALVAGLFFNGQYLRSGWAGNLSGQLIFILILIISLLFFIGFIYYSLINRQNKNMMVISIALTSVIFSAILGTFYNHYYLIVMPMLCLLIAVYWREVFRSKLLIIICILSIAGSYAVSLKQLYNNFFGSAHLEALQMSVAAKYVKDNTTATDKIIYHGYGATFYQLAKRDSGSRFISASHPLIDQREGFGYDFTNKHIEDMELNKPKYIIINNSTKRIYNQNQILVDYFNANYTFETEIPGYEILVRIN